MKKLFLVLACVLTTLSLCFLGGCEKPSANRKNFEFSYTECTCNYRGSTNKTTITMNVIIKNGTIYNVDKSIVTFELYRGDALVDTVKLEFGIPYIQSPTFKYEGQIDKAVPINVEVPLCSFWQTYKGTIIAILVLTFAAICVMMYFFYALDIDYEDTIGPLLLWAGGIVGVMALIALFIWNWVVSVTLVLGVATFMGVTALLTKDV